MAGLKRFYGIDDPQGLKFFIVHHSLDVEHSKVTRNLVAKYGETSEDEEEALNAVDEATAALNTFLDGVCAEYVAAKTERRKRPQRKKKRHGDNVPGLQ